MPETLNQHFEPQTSDTDAKPRRFHLRAAAVYIAYILFFVLYIKNAWIADDAYIIFRSIEQLFDGNGPVWNPHERVQSFTSVLWYWLLVIPRIISSDVYLNAIIMSALVCLGFLIVSRRLITNNFYFLLFVSLLSLSNGFFDFTSSGLENPLAYFLIVLYLYFYLQVFDADKQADMLKHIRYSALVFGLILLTRHDLLLLLAPSAVYLYWNFRERFGLTSWLRTGVLVATPIILWTLFSLFYYGFPFPNTAYAKLNTGIARMDLIAQGFKYFYAALLKDTFTFITILICTPLLLIAGRPVKLLGAGIILHLSYVLYIGGDFMFTRFLSYAFLICLLGLFSMKLQVIKNHKIAELINRHRVAGNTSLTVLIACFALFYPHTPVNSPFGYAQPALFHGVADERGHYQFASNLYLYLQYRTMEDPPKYFPYHLWSKMGYEYANSAQNIVRWNLIGYAGYFAGTKKIIVDEYALSDPLLSKLPMVDRKNWRIGHFLRDIPVGYYESLQQHTPMLRDPDLNEYYKKLRLITQGELLSSERLLTIIKMNLGLYNHWLERYKERSKEK